MATEKLVSVLIPSYNYARYMDETIKSICGQTYRNLEIIVLDDGSTDDSLDVAYRWAKKDKRLRVYSQSNKGLIVTLNSLLSAATGEYISQVDADDVLLPQRIQWGVEDLENDSELAATFCGFLHADGKNQIFGNMSQYFALGFEGKVLAQRLAITNHLCACTAVMRRSSLEKAGGFARNFSLVHDWDRWMRLSLVGNLKIRSDIGAVYRVHDKNQSLQEIESLRQQIEISNEMSTKLVSHYNMAPEIEGLIHSAMVRRYMKLKNHEKVVDHLSQKSLISPLEDFEKVWLLQCYMILHDFKKAHMLSKILFSSSEEFAGEYQSEIKRLHEVLCQYFQKNADNLELIG